MFLADLSPPPGHSRDVCGNAQRCAALTLYDLLPDYLAPVEDLDPLPPTSRLLPQRTPTFLKLIALVGVGRTFAYPKRAAEYLLL